MADVRKAMTISSNHVALEVGNFDEIAELQWEEQSSEA